MQTEETKFSYILKVDFNQTYIYIYIYMCVCVCVCVCVCQFGASYMFYIAILCNSIIIIYVNHNLWFLYIMFFVYFILCSFVYFLLIYY